MLPESMAVTMTCCSIPMLPKGGRFTWDGDYAVVTARYVCEQCGITAEVSTREDVGPPSGVA